MDALYIQPGELRHYVQVQEPTSTRDATGQPVAEWAVVLTARAAIEGTNSRTFKDSFGGNALASQSTALITLRWPGASVVIEPGMRVIHEDITYLIQAVDNVQRRNRKIVLACLAIDEGSN